MEDMMAQSNLIMALAKVIIAAAWADGKISNQEVNSLKDLLFRLPDMTARDWAELDIYLESPVAEGERARLVADLQDALGSRADKALARSALEDVLEADGAISPEEEQVLEQIEHALQDVNVSIFGKLGRLVSGPMSRRADGFERVPNREIHIDDFMKNKIFYNVQRRLQESGNADHTPEKVLRKLSLAGGLMARVAYVDQDVNEAEIDHMVGALQEHWGISEQEARLVAEVAVSEIAKNLDYYRLSREFFEITSEKERQQFLDVLFDVAGGDGLATHNEIEEIRRISKMLKLTHRQFIDAKLKLPSERRET
jgi:uncharacterized tellurite resistance protein B-like protein